MKKLIALIPVLILSLLAFSQKDPEAKRILDKTSTKFQTFNTFKANITYALEVPTNKSLNTTSTMDVLFKKGNNYYMKKSDGEETYCNGKYVWQYFDEECTKLDFDPEDVPIDIKKMLDTYDEEYKYMISGSETIGGVKYSVIDLNPDKSAEEMVSSDIFKIRMLINPKTYEVKQWIIFERNGNKHKFKINTFSPNVTIPDSKFAFDKSKYPGVEVEDLTE